MDARKTCAARSVLYKSVNHKGEMPYSCPTTHFPQQAEELNSNSRAYIINIMQHTGLSRRISVYYIGMTNDCSAGHSDAFVHFKI